jgi:DNA primase catalytic subunit
MFKFQILKYYSNPELQKYMIRIAEDREVVGTFEDGSYSKRPDILLYPRDIVEKVKNGIISFHCSVEKWKNPMQLSPQLNETQLENLRKDWDLIIDIDAKARLEHATIAAIEVCNFFRDYGVKPTVKFSGRRGFHIAISGNAFPQRVNFQPLFKLYPELPRAISEFVREKIKERLLEELIAFEGGVASLVKTVENVSELSPYAFIEIEKDWGLRHLFRMPFSLHHKTFLVSVPLDEKKLEKFDVEQADPLKLDKKVFSTPFLENKEGEAVNLAVDALDWISKRKVKLVAEEVKKPVRKAPKMTIPEEFFPPCIKEILKGLPDGRKRSIFTLATFLRQMNWKEEDIEKRIYEWNRNNKPPLRENYIRTQLKWHFRQSRELLPANCESDLFYKSIGVCKQDSFCEGLKNPINYPFKIIGKSKKKKVKRKKRGRRKRS